LNAISHLEMLALVLQRVNVTICFPKKKSMNVALRELKNFKNPFFQWSFLLSNSLLTFIQSSVLIQQDVITKGNLCALDFEKNNLER